MFICSGAKTNNDTMNRSLFLCFAVPFECSMSEVDMNIIQLDPNFKFDSFVRFSNTIHKHIPIVEAIGGVVVTYGIEVIRALTKQETPDYLAFVISILLLIIACVLAKHVPCFSASNNETNQVHLEDMLQLEDRIDKEKIKYR